MSFLLDVVKQHAAKRGSAIALEGAAGESLNWTALAQAIEVQVQQLRAVQGKYPVAILADQGLAHCVRDLALMEAAMPVLCLPRFFSPAQRAHALLECGARTLLRDSPSGMPGLHTEQIQSAGAASLPAGTARISYTSGSTGSPKGICLSAEHLLTVARAVVDAVGPAHVGRHLAMLPPGLLLESVAGCYATLMAGGTYLALPQAQVGLANPFRPDYQAMALAIESTRATSTILVPEYLSGLVAWLERSGLRLPNLGLVAVGGARVTARLLERAALLGLPVRQGYGLTECGSVVCLHQGGAEGRGSVGRSVGAHRVSLAVDGEILVEGPLMLSCVGEDRRSSVLHTGDIGRIDTSGNLWIDGRKSSLIVTSFGRNIAPEWIESLLLEQPAVAQAMVYGNECAQVSALIVAREPGAAVAAAISAVNLELPEYARIGSWREVVPFTPNNGLLTGNGRLRRDEISRRHLIAETADALL